MSTSTNSFHRLATLIVDVGARVLRNLLQKYVESQYDQNPRLDRFLQQHNTQLNQLQQEGRLTSEQMDILMPDSKSVHVNELDIALLWCLLTRVCNMSSTEDANMYLQEFRQHRNTIYGLNRVGGINEQDYMRNFENISETLEGLSKLCNNEIATRDLTNHMRSIQTRTDISDTTMAALCAWYEEEQQADVMNGQRTEKAFSVTSVKNIVQHAVLPFHDVFGENIQLDTGKIVAKWSPLTSGGSVLGERCIESDDLIRVIVTGSGHIEVGVIPCSPSELGNDIHKSLRDLSPYQMMNAVRIHKRQCFIDLCVNEDLDEVKSTFMDKSFIQRLKKGTKLWLAMDIRFGIINVQCVNKAASNRPYTLSKHCGQNIVLVEDCKTAESKVQNPAAACLYSRPLRLGHTLSFVCSPSTENGKVPSRYQLTVSLSYESPYELRESYKSKFQASASPGPYPSSRVVQMFEREECNGEIRIDLRDEDKVFYFSATGKKTSQSFQSDSDTEVWAMFELYRVELRFNKHTTVVKDVSLGSEQTPANHDQCSPAPKPYIRMYGAQAEYIGPLDAQLVSARQKENGEGDYDAEDKDYNTDDIGKYHNEKTANIQPNNPFSKYDTSPGSVQPISDNAIFAAVRVNEQQAGDLVDPVTLCENIRQSLVYLVNSLTPIPLIDYLYQDGVLSRNDYELISNQARKETTNANRHLLTTLSRKAVSKSKFVKALTKTNQEFLIPSFFPPSQ